MFFWELGNFGQHPGMQAPSDEPIGTGISALRPLEVEILLRKFCKTWKILTPWIVEFNRSYFENSPTNLEFYKFCWEHLFTLLIFLELNYLLNSTSFVGKLEILSRMQAPSLHSGESTGTSISALRPLELEILLRKLCKTWTNLVNPLHCRIQQVMSGKFAH